MQEVNMTEDKMRERIKEINEQRELLKGELVTYQNYFTDKRLKELQNERSKSVGKCYKTNGNSLNNNQEIFAFKILEAPLLNHNSTKCLVVLNDELKKKKGIIEENISLWSANKLRLLQKESDPKMIDFYYEISEKEFNQICDEMLSHILLKEQE